MNNKPERTVLWDQVALVALGFIILIGVTAYLHINFGATMALWVVISLIAVSLFLFGNITGRRDAIQATKIGADSVADSLHALAGAFTAQAKAQGASRQENALLLRQEMMEAKHVNRLADQRAKALVDAQQTSSGVWQPQSSMAAPQSSNGGFIEYS